MEGSSYVNQSFNHKSFKCPKFLLMGLFSFLTLKIEIALCSFPDLFILPILFPRKIPSLQDSGGAQGLFAGRSITLNHGQSRQLARFPERVMGQHWKRTNLAFRFALLFLSVFWLSFVILNC